MKRNEMVTKMVRNSLKGTKLRKRYEAAKKIRKGYELSYQAMKKVRSYEKIRSYEKGTKRLRNKLRKALVAKLPSYKIVTPPIGIICYDVE
jgi:hypothetical protein